MDHVLKIEKLVHGGYGLARTPQGVVFVNGVLAGESVEIDIVGKSGGLPVANATKILDPSPFRCSPACPHAARCGGCDWQHIVYERQVEYKKEILLDCLGRIAKLTCPPNIEVFASPQWVYRCRAQIKVDHAKKAIGFYQKQSTRVVDIDSCPLLVPSLNTLFARKQQILGSLTSRATQQIRAIAGSDGTVASMPALAGLTSASTHIEVAAARFVVRGDSFFQGNAFLHEKLGAWARPWVGGERFVDLYGGAGFFSVLLGGRFGRGVLVESEESLVKQAQANLNANGSAHVAARTEPAEDFLARRPSEAAGADCVIVDPPRPGLSPRAREGLAAARPGAILYVSCDPATQARDVGHFVKNCGYAIEHAALFDLYPQTHHIETALLLRLR